MSEDTPRVMTEAQIRADEISSRIFDDLVNDALLGKDVGVVVDWSPEDAGEYGFQESPTVTIGGLSSYDYVRRPMEYTTDDTELIRATAQALEEKIGKMWETTMDFYDELDVLGVAIDDLAISRDAGFSALVRKNFEEQGIAVGDGELMASARRLACSALVEWAEAVKAQSPEDEQS